MNVPKETLYKWAFALDLLGKQRLDQGFEKEAAFFFHLAEEMRKYAE